MADRQPGFQTFDHTADLGIRAWGGTRAEVVAQATEGLYAAIGTVVAELEDSRPWQFEAADADPELLLRDYLAELLALFETEHRRATGIVVQEFSESRLRVEAQAARIDPGRSELAREVKAVTYHELALRQADGGYEATFIVDI